MKSMPVQLSPSFFYTDILHAKKTKEKLSRDRVALFYEHASKFQPFLKNNIFFNICKKEVMNNTFFVFAHVRKHVGAYLSCCEDV